MTEPTLDKLVQRLDSLERNYRLFKVVAISSLVVLSLVLLVGASRSGIADKIVAREFQLVGKEGKIRARLGCFEACGLHLYDPVGTTVGSIATQTNGAALIMILAGRNTEVTAGLEVQPDGRAGLTIVNKKEKIALGVADGVSGLTFFDKYGRGRAIFGLDKGSPSIGFADENGKPVWAQP